MSEFLNVYNFVPLPKEKRKKYEDADKHTGVITYRITTKTPLFIPNTSSDAAFTFSEKVPEHKSYDFFSYREMKVGESYNTNPAEPVIPGSELRGMVRGIYETLTDSCMGVLNEEEQPVKRTMEMFQAGLLHKVGTEIFLISKYSEIKSADNKDCGYIIKGMSNNALKKRRYTRIFIEEKDEEYKLQLEHIENLRKVIKSYQAQPGAIDSYYEYEKQLNRFLDGKLRGKENKQQEYFPVCFSKIRFEKKELIYLAPARYTKEVSYNSVGKLAGQFCACDDEKLCPACDLFGNVGKNNETSYATKIRFTDAKVEKELDMKGYYYEKNNGIITLEDLGGPKLGNTEFYLKRPGMADFWTYDYYVEGGNVIIKPGVLRGRKYYWHQLGVSLPTTVKKTKLNKTVRPVRSDVSFIGKLYFDGISEKQLKQLLWILNCGETGSGIGYKLGGGKPLGLGSIVTEILKVEERELSLVDGILSYEESVKDAKEILISDYETLDFSKECKEAFMLISALDIKQKFGQEIRVSYPRTSLQTDILMKEGYKWFKENREFKARKKMRINRFLPVLNEEGPYTLPCHDETKGNKGSKGSGNKKGNQSNNRNGQMKKQGNGKKKHNWY